jgi:hypothetical protein
MTLSYRCSNCGIELMTTNADPVIDKIELLRTALKRIRSMDEKNLPKYAKEIAGDALDRC